MFQYVWHIFNLNPDSGSRRIISRRQIFLSAALGLRMAEVGSGIWMNVKLVYPHPTAAIGIIGLAEKSSQNTSPKRLSLKIHQTKELRAYFRSGSLSAHTAFAGTRMNEFGLRRKGRCHREAVDLGGEWQRRLRLARGVGKQPAACRVRTQSGMGTATSAEVLRRKTCAWGAGLRFLRMTKVRCGFVDVVFTRSIRLRSGQAAEAPLFHGAADDDVTARVRR